MPAACAQAILLPVLHPDEPDARIKRANPHAREAPQGRSSHARACKIWPDHRARHLGRRVQPSPRAVGPVQRGCARARAPGGKPRLADVPGSRVRDHGEYPADIFSVPDGKADKGLGQRFNSADGRSVLTIYARENEDDDTPASYLRKNLRVARSSLDYQRVTRSFFAISSEHQDIVLYSRCNFSTDAGGAIHCFDLVYPREDKRAWDSIVTRISRSLRPLES